MVPVVAVFGLSGVGKSWMISKFGNATEVKHVQASQLIREARAEMTGWLESPEDLRRGAVLDNQAILIAAFSRLNLTATTPIIFDGHSVIDAGDHLVEIPVDVIRALAPAGLIFIMDDPAAIVARRASDVARERPVRSKGEIESHQDRALAVCRRYADELAISLKIVQSGNEPKFSEAVMPLLFTE